MDYDQFLRLPTTRRRRLIDKKIELEERRRQEMKSK